MFFDLRCHKTCLGMTNVNKNFDFPNRLGKRRQVTKNECLHDLKIVLPKLFLAFEKGVKKYNTVASMFKHESKVRFNATVLNTAIIESLQNEFSENWKWGKYKRFILKVGDYIFLVKKMNNNNKPMNIKTQHVNTISNQLSLSLFDNEIYHDDPILFFGYKVDRMGEICSPQIVYIDESNVKWIVSENEVLSIKEFTNSIVPIKTVKVSLKEELRSKKASSN